MFVLTLILWHLAIDGVAPSPVPSTLGGGSPPLHPARDRRSALGSRSTSLESSSTAHHLTQTNLSQTLWSCSFLVFALAWIAVHPNYPSPYDSPWMKFRRRVMLVLWAILFPELVLYWSVRQWIGARKIREKFKDKGWSLTDAHFLQMGGLLLAPVHQKGPQGKPRFFTLTLPLLNVLYTKYAEQHTPAEPVPSASVEEAYPYPIPSSPTQPVEETGRHIPFGSNPSSSSSSSLVPPLPRRNSFTDIDSFPRPLDHISSVPRLVPPVPERSPLSEEISQAYPPSPSHASTSAAPSNVPPLRVFPKFPLPDFDTFLPPPDEIEPLELPPQPLEAEQGKAVNEPLGILSSKERKIMGLVLLASVHMHLPSCLRPPPCLESQSTPETNLESSINHIATTFPTDPLLAGVVVLQLVWFLSGCVARIALGGWRELLLVEVLVLAYISIYLMTIVAWWDKPAIGLGAEPTKIPIIGEVKKSRANLEAQKEIQEDSEKVVTLPDAQRSARSRDKGKEVVRDGASAQGGLSTGNQSAGYSEEDRVDALRAPPPRSSSPEHLFVDAGLGVNLPSSGGSNAPARLDPRRGEIDSNLDTHAANAVLHSGSRPGDAPSIASTLSEIEVDTTDEPVFSSVWKGLFVERPGSLYFHFDRVYEFFLKSTGYDEHSHEYELSTDPSYSNVLSDPRIWTRREGKRHWRRNKANADRLKLDSDREVNRARAGLVFGTGYQLQRDTGNAQFKNGQENGVSDSVRKRREAGSGGQSRLPTFYAYVTDKGYRSVQERKVKVFVGLLCGLLFGGVHLLGIAFKELPSSGSSLFDKASTSFPPEVIYLVCSILLTVIPFFVSFTSLQTAERLGDDGREEVAISYGLVESLGIPMTLLYFPARVGVVVVALLQIIRRFRLGTGTGGEIIGGLEGAFDGVNPTEAWWLDFLPHFA